MAFNSVIIHYLNIKAGFDVATPAGATNLAHDIEATIGEKLAANTIKRLVGVIPYNNTPRLTTLNIIGRYLGFSSWENFCEGLNYGSSAFGSFYPFIEVCKLKPGARISFKWEPGRKITIRHITACKCEVTRSTNSKLQVGDILFITQLSDGFPFYVKEVIREGSSLGSYCAARETGIYDIKVY